MANILRRSQDFVAKEYLLSLRDYALSKGITTDTLLKNTDQDTKFLLTPPNYVNEVLIHQIGKNICIALDGAMQASIELGQSMTLASHGILGMAIQGCENLHDTTLLASRYAKTRASSRTINIVYESHDLCIRYNETSTQSKRKYDEQFFSKFTSLVNIEVLIRQLLNQHSDTHHLDSQICELHIPHKPYPQFPFEKIQPGLTVKFNTDHLQLKIPLAWLKLSLPKGDLALAKMATQECEQYLKLHTPKDIVDEINAILEQEGNFNVSLFELALSMNMSVSTLQRRLKDVNSTFKEIKSQARLNQAKVLLKHSPQSIEFIAGKLGFSDASNFTKFFKVKAGMTPKGFRNLKINVNELNTATINEIR